MEINEPSVLTRIPRVSGQNGRTLFAQVQGVRNGVKRKRQEICAAIDGNSITIYEVLNGHTICSYPVPPDTRFKCAPCSIRSRTDSATTRRTYCVAGRRNEIYLQCFTEHSSLDEAKPQTSSTKLGQQPGNIIQIEYVCQSEKEGVLVLWDTGRFCFMTADLSNQINEGQFGLPETDGRILAYYCTSAVDASTSILKGRPDLAIAAGSSAVIVTAILQPLSNNAIDSKRLEYCVWTLPTSSVLSPDGLRRTPAISHILSTPTDLNLRERDGVTFLVKGTKVSLQSHARSITFDLASTIPRKVSDTALVTAIHVSSVNISDYLTLYSGDAGLQLYNTQFRSIQASFDMGKSTLKRRRGDEPIGAIVFVTYFPQLNRVIGTRQGHLLAIDINMPQATDASAAMKRSSLLINNIGRGTLDRAAGNDVQRQTATLGTISKSGSLARSGTLPVKQLEECLTKQDMKEFETLVMRNVSEATHADNFGGEMRILDGEIDYVLAKIMQTASDSENIADSSISGLTITLSVPRVLEWLISEGYLTTTRVKQALSASSKLKASATLNPDSITLALANFDPSLFILKKFLRKAPYIDLQNLCAATRVLIRKALELSAAPGVPSIEADRSQVDHEAVRADVLAKFSEDVDSSNVAAVDVAGMLVKSLERMSEYDPRTTSAVIRSSLEQQDLIALIQFLRQQLFQNGYTRSLQSQTYPSPPPSIDGALKQADRAKSVKSDLSLDAILSVMSSCIDVIGPLGLVSSGGEMEFIQTLVPELSSEVSRTMEALDDAAYLQGLLRETLRFAQSFRGSQLEKSEGIGHSVKRPGTITTVYAESATDKSLLNDTHALPLSLQADMQLNYAKLRKGGGQVRKRSKREMGMLQDRLRAPYALERLVL